MHKFVQPLLPHFLHSFSIPKLFVKYLQSDLKGDHLHTVVLMTDFKPRRHWVVIVENDRLFKDGWKEFCQHHELQIGEFLVFTYQSKLLFHVSVYEPRTACQRIVSSCHNPLSFPQTKGSERTKVVLDSTCGIEPNEGEANEEAANPSYRKGSRCLVNVTSSTLERGMLYLPVGFVRKNGLQFRTCEVLLKDAKKRVWPLNLHYKNCDGKSYIDRGLKSFLAANNLKPGHILSLQLLEGSSCPIIKCCRQENSGVESNSARETAPEKTQAEAVTINLPNQDSRKYPRCEVNLRTYAIKKSVIYIPAPFVSESGLKYRSCEVMVVDEKKRTWLVGLSYRRIDGRAVICRGWRDVQTANCFGHGDTICFQLLEAGECPTLKCYRCSTNAGERKQDYTT